jgi:hypothetical protein
VLVTRFREADEPRCEPLNFLLLPKSVVHVDRAAEHYEHLGPVVDMPLVRRISPVEPHGRLTEFGDLDCVPCPCTFKPGYVNELQGLAFLVIPLMCRGAEVLGGATRFHRVHSGVAVCIDGRRRGSR